MRLFHYALIPVLDNKHLISQWRELVAIKRQWEKGTLKHRLVSYVMDYDKKYFLSYVADIVAEMGRRKINYQSKFCEEIEEFCKKAKITDYINYPEHNDRYLKQCYYNLQEKADRGIISEEEWQKIEADKNIKNIVGEKRWSLKNLKKW